MFGTDKLPLSLLIGSGRVDLQNVQLRENILLDELHLEGGPVRLDLSGSDTPARVSSGDIRVRALMSEANLNRLFASSLSADAPVRNLEVALLSGRARISGKAMMTRVPVAFSLEAAPVVENGVRILLDCRTATVGIGLPHAVVEIIEQKINELLRLDVSKLEVPIWIDELRCEPGRLTAIGRVRAVWPPVTQNAVAHTRRQTQPTSNGFTISSEPLFGPVPERRWAIEAGPIESGRENGAEAVQD